MADEDIFPKMTREEILSRVREVWDLDGILPWPHETLNCASCGSGELHPRYWRFFRRQGFPESRVPYRCDVGVKCTRCSLVMVFGVAVPKEVYDRAPNRGHQLQWKDVQHAYERGDVEFEEIFAV